MRPIKFRVWDVDEEEWYNNEKIPYQLIDDEGVFYWADYYGWDPYPGEVLIMQFTGLLDKNGTEIYEGDIVKFYDIWDELTGGREKGKQRICRVEYVGSGFLVVQGDEEGYEQDLFMAKINDDDLEVIGNIYEHPELLGDSQ